MSDRKPPARGRPSARATADAGPRAVLFDLWGTLVPSPTGPRDTAIRAMAADLGVDPHAFAAAFRDSFRERFTGASGSPEDTIRLLAARCGGDPAATAVARATRRRLDLTRGLLVASDATLAVLDELRRRGFVLGLVTNCSSETPALWARTPLASRFDATAFSCLVGVCKPAPEVYLAATERLGVSPGLCAFVGDGDGRELSAAEALGMRAVRLRAASDDPSGRYDDDAAFRGAEVADLAELLAFPWAQRL